MTRLFHRLDDDQLSLGVYALGRGTEYVEVLGHCGLDFVIFDMMVAPLDWSDLADMVHVANSYGMTPFLRLQANPWLGGTDDPRLAADAMRAFSLGCQGVLASVSRREQIETMVDVVDDNHMRPWLRGPRHREVPPRRSDAASGAADPAREDDDVGSRRLIGPVIESKEAYDHLDRLLAVPGLRLFHLGMGDLSRELGYPREYMANAGLRTAVEDAVNIGKKYGAIAMVNCGMPIATEHPDALVDQVRWMWDTGIQAAILPYPTFAVEWFYHHAQRVLRDVAPEARL